MTWLLLQALAKLAIGVGFGIMLLAWLNRDDKGYEETLEERLDQALFDLMERDREIASLRQACARRQG